jgi:phospholipase C
VSSNFKKLSTAEIASVKANPRSSQWTTREAGISPARALPYEMYAEGELGAGGKQFDFS